MLMALLARTKWMEKLVQVCEIREEREKREKRERERERERERLSYVSTFLTVPGFGCVM